MDGISTVLLDIDGTVMDFSRGQRNAFLSSCLLHDIEFDDALYINFDAINKKFWKLFEHGKIQKNVLVYERFSELFQFANINADPISFEHSYQKLLGEQCYFIDGAFEGVKYLKSKYEIYIVTNGVKSTQLNRLNKSGLINFADKVFISEEVGYQKPSKEYFDAALDGVERSSAVILGDSMSSDIKGGIDANIRTVWFNLSGEKKVYEPTFEVRGWKDIYEIL